MIISKTYERDAVDERDGKRDKFQNCYIFAARRACCRTGFRVTTAINLSLPQRKTPHIALVCGQSRDFRVCRRVSRRVPDRARVRVGVFCS